MNNQKGYHVIPKGGLLSVRVHIPKSPHVIRTPYQVEFVQPWVYRTVIKVKSVYVIQFRTNVITSDV